MMVALVTECLKIIAEVLSNCQTIVGLFSRATLAVAQTMLIYNHGCAPENLPVQPRDIVRVHIDTAMTAIAVERRSAGWVAMREIHSLTIDTAPPAIV